MTSYQPDPAPDEEPVAAPTVIEADGRKRRRPSVVLIVAIVVIVAVAAAGAIGLVIYDRATAIDRSTPTVVTEEFLGAAIVDRDPSRVELFICSSWSADDAINKVTVSTGDGVVVTWDDIVSVTQEGRTAVVTIVIRFTYQQGGTAQRSTETWQIRLEDHRGWRVCDVSRGASLNP
jgi:hypothetical protein